VAEMPHPHSRGIVSMEIFPLMGRLPPRILEYNLYENLSFRSDTGRKEICGGQPEVSSSNDDALYLF